MNFDHELGSVYQVHYYSRLLRLLNLGSWWYKHGYATEKGLFQKATTSASVTCFYGIVFRGSQRTRRNICQE